MSKQHVPQTPEQKAAMQKPFSSQHCPYSVQLEPGKQYYYCACGLSKNQPFCDGSHKGSKFTPVKFTGKDQKLSYLCGCRRNDSQAVPYCDGSHTTIDW